MSKSFSFFVIKSKLGPKIKICDIVPSIYILLTSTENFNNVDAGITEKIKFKKLMLKNLLKKYFLSNPDIHIKYSTSKDREKYFLSHDVSLSLNRRLVLKISQFS